MWAGRHRSCPHRPASLSTTQRLQIWPNCADNSLEASAEMLPGCVAEGRGLNPPSVRATRSRPHDLGGLMSWSMFSCFGAGSKGTSLPIAAAHSGGRGGDLDHGVRLRTWPELTESRRVKAKTSLAHSSIDGGPLCTVSRQVTPSGVNLVASGPRPQIPSSGRGRFSLFLFFSLRLATEKSAKGRRRRHGICWPRRAISCWVDSIILEPSCTC